MAGEIIGRREELLALEAFLEAVPAGGPAFVPEGGSGIGQSAPRQEGRLLVGLDDVQWVDASSAGVIRFTLRRLEGEPVGVLATVTSGPLRCLSNSTGRSGDSGGSRSKPFLSGRSIGSFGAGLRST